MVVSRDELIAHIQALLRSNLAAGRLARALRAGLCGHGEGCIPPDPFPPGNLWLQILLAALLVLLSWLLGKKGTTDDDLREATLAAVRGLAGT